MIGTVLRTFSKTEDEARGRVKQLVGLVTHLDLLAIAETIIVIPSDERYAQADYGGTKALLEKERFGGPTTILQSLGDLYVTALNVGLAELLKRGVEWGLIMSPEARSYLSPSLVKAIGEAQKKEGVRSIGVTLHELGPRAFKGYIANTLAIWHIPSLFAVGGFDCLSAEVRKGEKAPEVSGHDPLTGTYRYPRHGVEEVIPLTRMVQLFGPCITLLPSGEGRYEEPTDPDLKRRNDAKFRSKELRQNAMLASAGLPPSLIEDGVI